MQNTQPPTVGPEITSPPVTDGPPPAPRSVYRILCETPVLSGSPIMPSVLGGLYIVGGLLGFLGARSPGTTDVARTVLAVVSVLCVAIGVAVVARRHRAQPLLVHSLVAFGVLCVGSTIFNHRDPLLALSASTFLFGVALCAAFCSWALTAMHLLIVNVVAFVGLATTSEDLIIPAVLVLSIVDVVTLVVGILVRLAGSSLRDGLTGVLNRRGFDASLELFEASSARTGDAALVVFDVDGLRAVNAQHGHAAGDAVLRRVANGLAVPRHEVKAVGRLGGDEFAVLISGGPQEAERFVESLRHDCHGVALSVGITSWSAKEPVSVVLRRAFAGLARAKRNDSPAAVVVPRYRHELSEPLAQTLAADGIDVIYQPLVSLTAPDTIEGVEALARWAPPTTEPVSPAEFIAIAETEGLIADLDQQVLRRATADVLRASDESGWNGSLFVNASGLDIVRQRFVKDLLDVVQDTGFPPQRLVIEVTESTLDAETAGAVANLHALRDHGIRVAIDDFGTGYSSLSRLHTLPVDFVKLDSSFVQALAGTNDTQLLEAISAMVKALDLRVVAEGVEHHNQALALADMGYDMAQGWLFHRGLDAPQLRATLGKAAR